MGVSYTLHHAIYNTLLAIKYLYSDHLLYSYYQDLMCYTYVLATYCLYYLYDTSI